MARTISIGGQGFAEIRERGAFLVDKTGFIRDWWMSYDDVTLVCRPRRFGKTLNLSMVECFLSTRFAGRTDLFEGLEVFNDEGMRAEQGAWPVVSLSFADVKPRTFDEMRAGIGQVLVDKCRMLWPDGYASALPLMRGPLEAIGDGMGDVTAKRAVSTMCEALFRQTGRKAVVLLDEYDTPLQEAWLAGFWDDAAEFMRGFFNSTFKTNPYLERALITGITRVAHESIFSDFNNPNVVTPTSGEYATSFGFTQAEVDAALAEYGREGDRAEVRDWYDGFTFGGTSHIYNPWSITNYLSKGRLSAYWANSSGNALVSLLVRRADNDFKGDFETLLQGGCVEELVSEQLAFPDLEYDSAAAWALLVSSGYLQAEETGEPGEDLFELRVTNHETMLAFDRMVRRWFARVRSPYNGFVRALLAGDLRAMNGYMNDVALDTFSTFDTGKRPSGSQPERFYHGFVLGLLVELRGRYLVRSNRESGYGRYDVLLEPVRPQDDDGIIMEFKVVDPESGEHSLEDAVAAAHEQIEGRRYAAELVARGVPEGHVRSYGFAFEGKRVLIG